MNESQPCQWSTKIYAPLNPQSKHIRVLHLLPGSQEEEIRCELSIATSKVPFQALSYVWGDSQYKKSITVQGETMEVTANLEAALRHLRSRCESRSLWVDAVCINQKDMAERKHQVGMMGTIYRDAEKVITWLGTGVHEDTIRLIRDMGGCPDQHWDSNRYPSTDPETTSLVIRLYGFLKETEWYQRIWTVQEAVLASSITYVCGSDVFENGEIDGLIQSFNTHFAIDKCCSLDAMTRMSHIANAAAHIQPYLQQMSYMVNIVDTESALPFLEIASQFRHRQATDPRDKVFGILGITQGLTTDIVDYEKSVAEIYATAALRIIENTGNLDILSHVLPRHSWFIGPIYQPAGLPSWAPDWSDSRERETWRLRSLIERQSYAKFFCACGPTSSPRSRDEREDPRKLVLSGRQCGSIARLGAPYNPANGRDTGQWPIEVIQDWRTMVEVDRKPQQVYGFASSREPGTTPTMMDAFWRTLCANIDPFTSNPDNIHEANLGTRACHDQWWWDCLLRTKYQDVPGAETQLSRSERHLNVFESHVIFMAAGRRFFVSGTGLIGLAPQDAQVGDEIWVVNGGRVPLIVRPLSSVQNGSHDDEYTFIGDSYVHGIMRGEFVEKQQTERTIVLV